MKQQNRRCKESDSTDPGFADALCGSESNSLSSGKQAQRKARQFCRQVQRALNLALAGLSASDRANELFVEDVSPAPDCGRLLVQVAVPAGLSAAEAIGALRRDAPRLRLEVARTITRKRAPELFFVPICPEGGADE